MKLFSSIKIKNLVELPRFLAKKAFTLFILLFFVSLIFSIFIFYQEFILVKRKEFSLIEVFPKVNQKVQEKILVIWQEKEKQFLESDNKNYPDIFSPKNSVALP